MARDRRGQRGVALALIAIALTAILSFCLVAVELGHLGLSTNEVQIVADSAATASARGLLGIRMGKFELPTISGLSVAAQNTVDGQPAQGLQVQVAVTQGTFDQATRAFTAGGANPNAVQATATSTVPTVLASIFGQTGTQIQRAAVASYGGSCTGNTALPITLGSCLFSRYASGGSCGSLPNIRNVPDPANDSCWTSLGPNPAKFSQASAYLPTACCRGGSCGGGQSAPRLQKGSQVNQLNGRDGTLLRIIKSCYDQGIRRFVVPVVDCAGNNNQGGNGNSCGPTHVVGFSTIQVTAVRVRGASKGIDVSAVCSADDPGPIGCSSYGRESVALVQ